MATLTVFLAAQPRQDTENVIMDASRLMADHGEDEYLRTYAGELFTKL